VALTSLTFLSLFAFKNRESDSLAIARIQSTTAKAPDIEYPSKDIRGRNIPEFDYLVVFPDCSSCSDARIKYRAFMNANPGLVFLIITPDMKDLADLLSRDRFFVFQSSPNSVQSEIAPGLYAR
jgi:hypothetical protein